MAEPKRVTRRSRPASRIVSGVVPLERTAAQVRKHFRSLLASGAALRPAGQARHDPEVLLQPRYLPRHELHLFDATIFLSDLKHDEGLGFFVAYVLLEPENGKLPESIYPRLVYKDSSLMWRVASHFIHTAEEYWIGKGDVHVEVHDGQDFVSSREETTNLPFELQFALDHASRTRTRTRDDDAVELIVRQGNASRTAPYADFSAPRRAAAERYSIHGDRPIARFRRAGDPSTLVFARGFEPDFSRGLLEQNATQSKFFGGELRKFRILSTNRQIQYLFFASPTHAWLTHPQAMSSELSSYAVRTVDVFAPDDLAVPGFEYHEEGDSQIPAGYAGAPNPMDPHRADASAWLERLPVIQEFRRKILNRGKRPPARGNQRNARKA